LTSPAPDAGNLALRRVGALALRHLFLLRGSWPRLLEIFYWPLLNMLLWGYTSIYVYQNADAPSFAFGLFVGAVIIWSFTIRTSANMMVLFMEEIWSRNLGHLFVAPYRPFEYVVSLILISALRTALGVLGCVIVARVAFGFDILDIGLPLAGFIVNLMMCGWWVGLLLVALMLPPIFNPGYSAWTEEPVAVRIEVKELQRFQIAEVEMDLPSGVSFYSEKNPSLNGKSSVVVTWNKEWEKRSFPFVIRSTELGKKVVKVRFRNNEGVVVLEKELVLRFRERAKT
jgi:hypothetical protein